MGTRSNRQKITIALLVFLIATVACSITGQKKSPSIIGTWNAGVQGTALSFVFDGSGGFTYSMNGQEVAKGQYAVIDTLQPIGIDLLYSGDNGGIFTIIEFPDSNTLKMENNAPGALRPTQFKDIMVFTRSYP